MTLLVGLFVFLSIRDQIVVFSNDGLSGVSARTLPYLITSAIILLSLLKIVSNAIGNLKGETDSLEDGPKEATSYLRVLLAFSAIALWIIILPYLGYEISTMMLVASVMIIIGNCRWWQIVTLSLILSIPVKHLLANVFRVYLPSGSVFG
ncbi:MAG: tripartite tricarboxylate transporter TctB family protein [Albidovulum sp.]|nr:tripartite tricarboxylate transporter TctB family protein [Albidovulum sp.]